MGCRSTFGWHLLGRAIDALIRRIRGDSVVPPFPEVSARRSGFRFNRKTWVISGTAVGVVVAIALVLSWNGSKGKFEKGSISNFAISPDGRSVVLSRSIKNRSALYRVWLDTGAASRLTDGNAWEEYSPTFSEDGKQIAFVRQQESGSTSRIFLMNSDGSNLHPLFSSDSSRDSAPHFTGTHILFARIAEQVSPDPPGPAPWDVYMASVDGGPAVPLTTRHYSTHSGPSFSDDASRFLYSMSGLSPEALYVIPLNAPPQTPEPLLFQIPNGTTPRIYGSPSLAPDGKSVVFLAAAQGKKAFDYDAFRLDLGSNRITQLTTDNGYASDLAISPDGNWAVFLRWTSLGSLPTLSRMYLLNLNTGAVAPLPITGTR